VTPLIAVIDDDRGVVEALCSLIRSLGFDTLACASAEAFLASSQFDQVACVVTDLSMPGIGGIGLKRVIDARGLVVPVIRMTGRRDPALLASAVSTQPAGLFEKPVDPAELCACIMASVTARREGDR
jgi:FixJ family two-component response regulator